MNLGIYMTVFFDFKINKFIEFSRDVRMQRVGNIIRELVVMAAYMRNHTCARQGSVDRVRELDLI